VDRGELIDQLREIAPKVLPYAAPVWRLLDEARRAGRRILFEGAQGVMLDVDHGTYPFVTSSSATAGGAATGLGIGPKSIGTVIGVAKAYTTRVGSGPLPTELTGEAGERLRETGQEFGASTGRPRRCGWFDAVAVRYAVRINGLDALAVTKLDVLDVFDEIPVCTGYQCRGELLTEMPSDTAQLAACTPVYETLPGWRTSTQGITRFEDLPREARDYIRRLEEVCGVPTALISTGSDRDHTIVREGSVLGEWLAPSVTD
jgi:adenylosuccinate synthase